MVDDSESPRAFHRWYAPLPSGPSSPPAVEARGRVRFQPLARLRPHGHVQQSVQAVVLRANSSWSSGPVQTPGPLGRSLPRQQGIEDCLAVGIQMPQCMLQPHIEAVPAVLLARHWPLCRRPALVHRVGRCPIPAPGRSEEAVPDGH